ncbi:MAG: hypothetical protein LBS88_03995 [Tannerellaceae bacterium]|jgi:hypothetical protein|nr:hypothetical protein [Tannerellaceae bacterium]
MKKLFLIIFAGFIAIFSSCDDMFKGMDVPNENQPNINDLATPSEFYSLLKNGYNTWYNGSIAASPTMAFVCAELFQSGTSSWGSGEAWFRPRRTLFNDDTPDPVIIINFGAWYNYYGSVGSAVKMSKMFEDPSFRITLSGVDYTNRAKAHSYLIQALLYGNIALLYDKAYLFTEEHDALTFDYVSNTKGYKEVMDYALTKLDDAIRIIESDAIDNDPVQVIAGVDFSKESLLQFAHSIGARFLVCLPRTQEENARVDWNKVKAYAEKGLQQDFKVSYDDGWRGKVMTRDYGMNYFVMYNYNWQRASQWLFSKMAPDDPASVYPIPVEEGSDSFKDWPEITNCPDKRLDKYFKYETMRNWFGADRTTRPGYGTYILSQYRYWRYYDVVEKAQGYVDHYLKMENDTYLAEAIVRTQGDKSKIAELINNSRVGIGELPPATAAETYDELEEKLFYERYVECDLVWPQLGFFDRRRNKDQMIPGTVRHFPIPGPELKIHGQELYTFGGLSNEM